MVTRIDRVRKNTYGHALIRTLCIKEKNVLAIWWRHLEDVFNAWLRLSFFFLILLLEGNCSLGWGYFIFLFSLKKKNHLEPSLWFKGFWHLLSGGDFINIYKFVHLEDESQDRLLLTGVASIDKRLWLWKKHLYRKTFPYKTPMGDFSGEANNRTTWRQNLEVPHAFHSSNDKKQT